MWYIRIIWDDEDNPDGNVQHIADHGLTIDDIEYVLENRTAEETSRTTGRPCCFGYTPGGDYIIVHYDQIDNAILVAIAGMLVSCRHAHNGARSNGGIFHAW